MLNIKANPCEDVAAPHPGNTVKQADPHDNFHSGRFLFARFRTADSRRAQILHFNNELLRPINHTKEEFVEVLGGHPW